MRTGGPRRMSEKPPSTVTGMASRSTAAATPAGRSFLPTPPTDVLPLDTSPESVSAPGLAYSRDRKSTRLNSSHSQISYAVFCLKKKKKRHEKHEFVKYMVD